MPIEIKDDGHAPATAAPAALATEAQPYSVQAAAGSARAAQFAKSEMEPAFLLFHHPRRWQLDADGQPIPALAKMAIEPGIGGVDARGNYSIARAQREQAGETMIVEVAARATDTPDGQPGYVRRTLTAAGPYFHSAWERINVVDGEGRLEQLDPAGYRRWLRALVERGVIPDVSERTVTRLRETLERSLTGEVSRDTEGAKKAVKAIQRQIDGLDKWAATRAAAAAKAAGGAGV